MRILVVLFISTFLLASCGESKLPNSPLEHFAKTVEVKASKVVDLEEQFDILAPHDICVTSNWIALRDNGSTDQCIFLIKKDFSKAYKGISRGQGPDEISNDTAEPRAIRDSVYVVDINWRRVLAVDVEDDKFKVVNRAPFNSFGGYGFQILPNDRVIQCIYRDTIKFIKLCETRTGDELSYINWPNNPTLSKYNGYIQNTVYANTLVAASPDGSRFAYGVMDTDQYGFGRIDDDRLQVDVEYSYSPIKIGTIYNNQILIVDYKKNITNVLKALGTNNHAVFLYSGLPMESDEVGSGNNILVYSWDGTPHFRLKLDRRVNSITYDEDRNMLMCLCDIPESLYVEYDLNGVTDL